MVKPKAEWKKCRLQQQKFDILKHMPHSTGI